MINSEIRSSYFRIFVFLSIAVASFLLYLQWKLIFFLPGVVFAVIALYSGTDLLVDQSGNISSRIGLSNKMEGVLILSLAAVADEFFLTLIAAFGGHGGISFGAVQGSNDFTVASILIVAPAFAVALRLREFRKDIAYMMVADGVIIAVSYAFNTVPVYFSPVFLVLFMIYFLLTARNSSVEPEKVEGTDYSVVALILALVTIFFTSYFVISYSEFFSSAIHTSDFLSGFLISGVAGSVPEITIISITLKRKKNAASTGVIIASTTYKLTLIMGVVALVGNLDLQFSKWSSYLLLVMGLIMLSFKKDPGRLLAPLIGGVIIAATVLLYLFE